MIPAPANRTSSSGSASPPAKPDSEFATSPPRNSSTNSPRPPTNDDCRDSLPATGDSICSVSTNWATSSSTPEAQSCCSRSSPNAKKNHRSQSPRTCPSANGAKSSATPASCQPSSTASRSTRTSSKPATTPTDSAPPADNERVGPNQTSKVGPIRLDIPMHRKIVAALTSSSSARS